MGSVPLQFKKENCEKKLCWSNYRTEECECFTHMLYLVAKIRVRTREKGRFVLYIIFDTKLFILPFKNGTPK